MHRGIAVLFHSVPSAASATQHEARRATASGARSFKGALRFIAGRRYESNAFAEYFRSYEMRGGRERGREGGSRPGNLSYLPSRPINVPGPRLLFFSPRDIRPRFKIASSSPFRPSCFHFLSLFRIPFLFSFPFCRSHLLVDISSFSPPYLRPFRVPFVVRSPFLLFFSV